jgi:hypothetical protein
VLRHQNAVLHRHAGRVRYEPGARVWFVALVGTLRREPLDRVLILGEGPSAG